MLKKIVSLSFRVLPDAENVINVPFPKDGSRMGGTKSLLFPEVPEYVCWEMLERIFCPWPCL